MVKKTKRGHLLLFLTLVFALALRSYFFVGLDWEDDLSYIHYARSVRRGDFRFHPYPPAMRMMMIYSTLLNFLVLGINNISLVLFPLTCALGSVVVTFYLGKILFDENVGLVSSFLLSIFPLDVIFSTILMPDVPIAFFMALAILLFMKSKRVENRRKKKVLLLISGITLGFAYLTKETAIIGFLVLIPSILHDCYRKRKIDLDYSLVFVGFSMVFILEGFIFYRATGDFFYRYRSIMEYFGGENVIEKHGLNVDLRYYPIGMLNLDWNYRFNLQNPHRSNFGIVYYFVFLAMLYSILKRKKEPRFTIFWFAILFLFLEFGIMDLKTLTPIHKLYRHLTVLTIPAMLTLSYFLLQISSSSVGKCASLLMLLTIFFTSIYYIHHRHSFYVASTHDLIESYNFLKDVMTEDSKIYAEAGAIGHINFYSNYAWEENAIPIGKWVSCDRIRNSFVIINATRGSVEMKEYIESKPPCFRDPPEDWILLKTVEGPKLDVYARFDPKIYYVE